MAGTTTEGEREKNGKREREKKVKREIMRRKIISKK